LMDKVRRSISSAPMGSTAWAASASSASTTSLNSSCRRSCWLKLLLAWLCRCSTRYSGGSGVTPRSCQPQPASRVTVKIQATIRISILSAGVHYGALAQRATPVAPDGSVGDDVHQFPWHHNHFADG